MNHQQALTLYIAAFISELVQTGVKDVVVSPGSRSTPIAMVMAEHPDLRLHIHVDESSAAFFAWDCQSFWKAYGSFYVHQVRPLRTTFQP